MKMTLISILSSWLCATSVAIIAAYCILTHYQDTPEDQKRAAEEAARISRQGTIPQYGVKFRHSSVVKKTTTAKVKKVVTMPTYVENPIYPSFTNALNRVSAEVASIAKDGEVMLRDGFVLENNNGKPVIKFPEEYTRVVIGGVAMGDELDGWKFPVRSKVIDGNYNRKVEEVALSKCKRLEDPEFYCTTVRYSALPATRQVDAIHMHGDLEIKNTSKAYEIVKEVAEWMQEDYGAVELVVPPKAGVVALKKFRIGAAMAVEVAVRWNRYRTEEHGDAHIDISFTTGELAEENLSERKELGAAVDAARIRELENSGVNYLTVRPKVNAEAVARKVVW